MSPAPQRRILIVGGGITGLAAAVTLVDSPGVSVELWEASDRLGGKLKSSPFAGVEAVDEGADAYLTRVPFAVDFARHVGLDDASSHQGIGERVVRPNARHSRRCLARHAGIDPAIRDRIPAIPDGEVASSPRTPAAANGP